MSTDYFPWFRFRAADFIGGTAGMTMEERGAYITLLSHQWMHGPLPADPQDLARICGGVTVSKRVIDKFRNVEGTPHCINDKLEEDRAHALKSRDGSKKRQRKHKKAKGKSNALPERDETVTKPLPSISNTTVGSMGEPSKPKAPTKREQFETAWKAYPDKSGSKEKAFAAFERSGDDLQTVLDGIGRYMRSVQDKRNAGFPDLRFKYGSTFFNGMEWRSEWQEQDAGQTPQQNWTPDQLDAFYNKQGQQ